MTKLRNATGGAYCSRGRWFARITIAAQKRQSVLLPWADEALANARAQILQRLVSDLREAGHTDYGPGSYIATVLEQGSDADVSKLAEVEKVVAAICAGKAKRKLEPVASKRDLETKADLFLVAVKPELDEQTHDTLRQYTAHWVKRFGPTVDDMASDVALARWMSRRLGQVLGETVKKELWGIKRFLQWCVEERVIDKLPTMPTLPKTKKGEGVRVGPQRAKPVELTVEQKEALVAAMSDRAWPRFAFMKETGLRPETINRLSTPEHYVKGRSAVKITDEIDKARYGRELPISDKAREILDALCDAQSEPGPLFGPEYFQDFKDAVAACGLPPETAPYDLRHAKVTHALEATGNLLGVGYLVGHKKASTTDRYAHANRKAAEDVLEALDGRRDRGGKRGGTGTTAMARSVEDASDIAKLPRSLHASDAWSDRPVPLPPSHQDGRRRLEPDGRAHREVAPAT
jgi:site-specific recombinase XerC